MYYYIKTKFTNKNLFYLDINGVITLDFYFILIKFLCEKYII